MRIFPDAEGQRTLQFLARSGRISNSFETLWLSVLPAKMKNIRSKMKALECSQHYNINFSDAQGQITPESVVVSGQNLNSSKLLCMSLLPARMTMIQSKMKELEWSQHFPHYKSKGIFSRRPRASNFAVLGPIWSNFELIRDVMDVLVTCNYEENPIKTKALECSQHFPHYNPMGAFR